MPRARHTTAAALTALTLAASLLAAPSALAAEMATPEPGAAAPETTVTPEATAEIAAVAAIDLAPGDLVITELAPNNAGAEGFEFVELTNTTTSDIDLDAAGVTIAYQLADTNEPQSPEAVFATPAGTVIAAGETVVLWVRYAANAGSTDEQFRASWTGAGAPASDYRIVSVDGAGLSNAGGRGVRVSDADGLLSRAFYPVGSVGDGLTAHYDAASTAVPTPMIATQATPTPGLPGPIAAPVEDLQPGDLVITEIAPNSPGAELYEFIELTNTTDDDIDLDARGVEIAYMLSDVDAAQDTDTVFPTPAGTVVPANSSTVLWVRYGSNLPLTDADFRAAWTAAGASVDDYALVSVTGTGLANGGNRGVRVSDADGMLARSFVPAGAAGDGTTVHFDAATTAVAAPVVAQLATATPGRPGPIPVAPAEPGALVVTEIGPDNAGSDQYEFFEVTNRGAADIDLNAEGVTLSYIWADADAVGANDKQLVIPAGTVIPAGGTTVFWMDNGSNGERTEAEFRAGWAASGATGTDYPIVRVTGQQGMTNSGNRGIRIADADGVIGRSFYPAGSTSDGFTAHFDPATETVGADLILGNGVPTPGTATDRAAAATLAPGSLVVTELGLDATGLEAFRFFEVTNTTARSIDLAQVGARFAALAADGDDRADDAALALAQAPVLAAGGSAVVWVGGDAAATEADFHAAWTATGAADGAYTLVRATGADAAAFGIRVTDGAGAEIARSFSRTTTAAIGRTDHFGAAEGVSAALLARDAVATPGSALPGLSLDPDPTLVTAPLQITEVLPDSAVNMPDGADAYEFIEVYNSTTSTIDLRDYRLTYATVAANDSAGTPLATVPWEISPEGVIEPGDAIVVWVKNPYNQELDVDDFNAAFGTGLRAGVDLFETHVDGMANNTTRQLAIVTNTGITVSRAWYNLGGVDQTNPDRGIQYAVDTADTTRQTNLGAEAATPGAVAPSQVPAGLMVLPTDETAPAVVDETPATLDPANDLVFTVHATDAATLKTVRVEASDDTGAVVRTLDLEASDDDRWSALVPSVDLAASAWVEYTVTVSDGPNRVVSDVRRITLDRPVLPPVAVSLADGDAVGGDVTVRGTVDDPSRAVTLAVDGEELEPLTPQLAAQARFAFDVNGIGFFYQNAVIVNGQSLLVMDDWIPAWTTKTIEVPLDDVVIGEDLTVEVWSGTKLAPVDDPNEENDDFQMRNPRLVLPDGRTIEAADYVRDTVVSIGDATADRLRHYDAVFDIPDDAFSARAATWETTTVADGEHVVTASTPGEPDARATVLVDNTAPAVSTTVEAREYRGAFTIDASAEDGGSGVTAALEATLDGESISLPYETSSVDLPEGAHELVVTATDVVGNRGVGSVTFTTPNEFPTITAMTADGAELAEGDVDLDVTAEDPNGDALAIDVFRAHTPQITGESGTTTTSADPAAGSSTAMTAEELAEVATVDGVDLSVSSDDALPFQLFTAAVPADAGEDYEARIAWTGSANANAKVLLYARSAGTGEWVELDRHVTTSTEQFELTDTVAASGFAVDGVIEVLVQHSEGYAGAPLSTRESVIEPANAADTPRDEYDFTIASLSDTQFYNYSDELYPQFVAMADYLVAQRENLNIQYMVHAGDILENSKVAEEWVRADAQFDKLDAAGLPYGLLAGNHDVNHYDPFNPDYAEYFDYFGAERYEGLPWFAESYDNNRGHVDLITAGGIDFVFVYTGWGTADAEIAWMNEVLARYPERTAVIVQHEYLSITGGLSPMPQRIFDEVIVPNENVRLVMSGHFHDALTRTDEIDDSGDGVADRTVTSMLFNYQGAAQGGEGFLRLLQFDNADAEMHVRTYSPAIDRYNSEDPGIVLDGEDRYANQDFVVSYETLGLEPATKELRTDGFAVDVLGSELIGSVTEVASGAPVSVEWTDVEPGSYAWFARATDPYGASVTSAVHRVSVVPASTDPTEPTDPTDPTDPTTPVVPVVPADGGLTAANEGGLGAPATVTAGQAVRLTVERGAAGQQTYAWLFSTPTAAGSGVLASDLGLTALIPVDAALGEHRLVVSAADGTVLGWEAVTVVAADAVGALPATGGQVVGLWLAVALLLAGLAAVVIARARRVARSR